MARNLDTALLRAFVAVADMGGMTAAAGRLNLTQAAISQQVKRLEEQLSTQLFERSRRGLMRTHAGDRLYAKARALLSINDEIWTMMTRPEFEGEVRFGVPYDIINSFVPDALRRFDRAWPRVHVTLDCSTTPLLLEKLARGETDIILTTEDSTPRRATRLIDDRLVWAGVKDGSAVHQKPVPVAMVEETCAFRPIVEGALVRAGVEWGLSADSGHAQATEAIIRADLAIGVFLASTMPAGLVPLPTDSGLPALPPFYINLYLPRFGVSEVALELARHIRETVADTNAQAA